MTTNDLAVRLLAAADGQPAPDAPGAQDRFMVDGSDSEGRFALVQHLFAPRALAAPMHRHHKRTSTPTCSPAGSAPCWAGSR